MPICINKADGLAAVERSTQNNMAATVSRVFGSIHTNLCRK